MPVRFLTAFLLSAGITFGLFWVMQALIGAEGELDESGKRSVVDFVRLKREEASEDKKRELPKKKPPEEPPPPPDLNLSQNQNPDSDMGDSLAIATSDIDLGGAPTLALVRVEPIYPQRAAQRGIEGWVEVEFTITAAGTVKNPRVTAYEPSSVFNRAALKAIRKWKYNPKIEDGKAVERPGVRQRLRFTLDS
jgi:protein TonB